MVIQKPVVTVQQPGDMHNINRVGAAQAAGMRHLHLTVGAVAGKDDAFDRWGHIVCFSTL